MSNRTSVDSIGYSGDERPDDSILRDGYEWTWDGSLPLGPIRMATEEEAGLVRLASNDVVDEAVDDSRAMTAVKTYRAIGNRISTSTELARDDYAVSESVVKDIEDRLDELFIDPDKTNAREWTEDTVSKQEAEEGTSDKRRAWTAERIKQAFIAFFDSVTSSYAKQVLNSTNAAEFKQALDLDRVDNSPDVEKLASHDVINKLSHKVDKTVTITGHDGIEVVGDLVDGVELSLTYGTTANTVTEGDDPRLSDSREWKADTATKQQVEDSTNTTRLAFTPHRIWQAITKALSDYEARSNRVGMVEAYLGNGLPTGYLPCDGSLVSRATYPVLFSVIGVRYGSTSVANFRLPDFRGMFLRGLGGNSAALDTVQTDAIRNIVGTTNGHNRWNGLYRGGLVSGAFTAVNYAGYHNVSSGGSDSGMYYSFDASRVVPTDVENRPINMAVNYVIKY